MTLGERLKFLRQGRGLKQEELAASIGITQSSIANYETNFRKPPYDVLIKLADFYGVATDFLLRGMVPFSQDEGKANVREVPVVRKISVEEREHRPVFQVVSHYEPVLLKPEDKADYYYYPAGDVVWTGPRVDSGGKFLVREQGTASNGELILGAWTAENEVFFGYYFEAEDVVVIQPWIVHQRPYILKKQEVGEQLVITGIVVSVTYCLDKEMEKEEESEAGFGEVG